MELLISSAYAQSGGDAGGGLLGLLPLVLIFVLFYFLLIRPQQKRTKKHKEMVGALEMGDEVATNGGTVGRVVEVDENFIQLEIAKGVAVQVQRLAVAQLLPEGSYKMSASKSPTQSRRRSKKSLPEELPEDTSD